MPTPKTQWIRLEPGFGNLPFGDPNTVPIDLRIYMRGFGNPRTVWRRVETGDVY